MIALLVLHQPRRASDDVLPDPRADPLVLVLRIVKIDVLEKGLYVTLKPAVAPRHLSHETKSAPTHVDASVGSE